MPINARIATIPTIIHTILEVDRLFPPASTAEESMVVPSGCDSALLLLPVKVLSSKMLSVSTVPDSVISEIAEAVLLLSESETAD